MTTVLDGAGDVVGTVGKAAVLDGAGDVDGPLDGAGTAVGLD
jgi:hypothetical protein